MPQLIAHIDAIARQQRRTILYLEFHPAERVAWRSYRHEHDPVRAGILAWLDANGYRITGNSVMTGNGSLAGFNGSPVTVEITGGSAMPFSNLSITFFGGAANHFGTGTIKGVVTQER